MLIPHILEVPLESVVPALSSLNDTESAPMLALQCDESPVTSAGVVVESRVLSDSLQPHGSPAGSSCSWDFPGKKTGVTCHFLVVK